jgi:2-C-methyl-D-erythritol 4-phosphate cytidylyltransferase
MMKANAVIVSAGKGLRFIEGQKKQFHLLEEKPILAHTLDQFEKCPLIDAILLVLAKEDMHYGLQEIIGKYNYHKISQIIPGGSRRQESAKNGIDALPADVDIVAIHDGVRPFVTREMIEESIRSAIRFKAVVFGVPVKDTIKISNPDGTIFKTLNRESLWQIQTPQTFQVTLIRDAYVKAAEDGFIGTDDASLVERLGTKVHILPGSYTNIKITTPEDLILASHYLKMKTLTRLDQTSGRKYE